MRLRSDHALATKNYVPLSTLTPKNAFYCLFETVGEFLAVGLLMVALTLTVAIRVGTQSIMHATIHPQKKRADESSSLGVERGGEDDEPKLRDNRHEHHVDANRGGYDNVDERGVNMLKKYPWSALLIPVKISDSGYGKNSIVDCENRPASNSLVALND